jgi:hypothetical protein
MSSVSQPKSDRLGHFMSSLSIYSCNLWCKSKVPTNSPNVTLGDLDNTPKVLDQSATKYLW